ncbi:dynein intermediate chain 3, ciliary-like [Aricia agestis]|uniref:dynein intermediate chain 3, ciliary-like n=1 Tax=Aricia agestis TaxID=91739 RepID=UPI001C2050F9|nr:dynein intermediate chain 3, ciliary-like [Aricia agestis]
MKRYQYSRVYTKLRKSFGRQPLFQNVPGHMLDSINPDKKMQKEYGLRNPVHREVQVTLPQSEHDSNTKNVIVTDQGINHIEGGWPLDVHVYNEDHLARHRRKVQHDENYVHTVMSLNARIEHNIQQNNAIEMYESYFTDTKPEPPVEKYNIQIKHVFRDSMERPVASVGWTLEDHSKIVASYCHKVYPDGNATDGTACYMWDVHKGTVPVYEFDPGHGCWDFDCSPVDSDLIIAGLDVGIVQLFDVRAGKSASASSSIYNSHHAPVSSVRYTHTKTGTQFFSGSPDGQCLWWDTRNSSSPIDQLPISVKLGPNETPSLKNSEGVSCLEFDKGLIAKFLVGTESGLIIHANRMGRNHQEVLYSHCEAHTGPVKAIHRSPCTLRMFISCGDYSVRIWSEEVRTAPIIVTKPYSHLVTDVAWAPLRYSSFMVASEDGVFYYWDLLRKYREPVATLNVSKNCLNKVAPHPKGKSVVVGDDKGSLYVLNLSENMMSPGPNDKQLMHETYERETRREHILDLRVKEMKLKIQNEGNKPDVATLDDDKDEDLVEETKRYFEIVKEEQKNVGGYF